MKDFKLIGLAELEEMNENELGNLKGGFCNAAIKSDESEDSTSYDSDNNDHFSEPGNDK